MKMLGALFLVSFSSLSMASRLDMNWAGILNIKYNVDFSRAYSTQVISLSLSPRKTWYVEVGEPTFANQSRDAMLKDAGIKRFSGDVRGSVDNFLMTRKVNFEVGDYYFVGEAKDLQSAIVGRIYEKKSDLFAGYFELQARHDGGDSYGFNVQERDFPCLQDQKPPAHCFGPGQP